MASQLLHRSSAGWQDKIALVQEQNAQERKDAFHSKPFLNWLEAQRRILLPERDGFERRR